MGERLFALANCALRTAGLGGILAPLPLPAEPTRLVEPRPTLSPRPSDADPGARTFLTGVKEDVVLERSIPLLRDAFKSGATLFCTGCMFCTLYDGESVCLGDSDSTTREGGEVILPRATLSVGEDCCEGSLFSMSSRTSSIRFELERLENALANDAEDGEEAAEMDARLEPAKEARGRRVACV